MTTLCIIRRFYCRRRRRRSDGWEVEIAVAAIEKATMVAASRLAMMMMMK
jgi:hypothetical protein